MNQRPVNRRLLWWALAFVTLEGTIGLAVWRASQTCWSC
ncbi:hypothetical protein DFP88_11145 [Pseudoroseicyclus aestuarii]|uniref:Uncharacterized protein n=1 Tax=Pseudoroseicyclus aestuarii TaxID=1795041 RepID=A0A318SMC6_9RHOB|nr:hypothetical protein DFP88_11145 [Pseudoroseicyclus aestuarii]